MDDSLLSDGLDRRRFLQATGGTALLTSLGATASLAADGDAGATEVAPYELPTLSYDYDALEPHIDRRIMELHRQEHHQSYVDGANDALARFAQMREGDDFESVKAAKRDYSFNLSGHVNHSLFWENMSPDGGEGPEGELAEGFDEWFGSFDAFRAEFTAAAENVEGDGWAMLFYEPVAGRLVVGQVESQNGLAHRGSVPLLGLDVWEHAYYLQYENDRSAYVEAWWNVVDWSDVGRRYETVRRYAADALDAFSGDEQ